MCRSYNAKHGIVCTLKAKQNIEKRAPTTHAHRANSMRDVKRDIIYVYFSPGRVEHGEGQVEAPLLRVVFDGEGRGVDEHDPAEKLQQHQAVSPGRLVQVQHLAGVEKLQYRYKDLLK